MTSFHLIYHFTEPHKHEIILPESTNKLYEEFDIPEPSNLLNIVPLELLFKSNKYNHNSIVKSSESKCKNLNY